MGKISAIIVDDEAEARDIMSNLLEEFSEVEVLSMDAGVDEAFQSVQKFRPKLVFLDIDMPEKNGFELIRMLKTSAFRPAFIFITAYNQFAIEAIKHAAFDYLLKPVNMDELRASIERYKEESDKKTTLGRIENLLLALQEEKISFNSRSGTLYLYPDDIAYCKADGNYSTLYLVGKSAQTVTMNLGRLETHLPVGRFAKISRSLIINKSYLSEIKRKEKTCKLLVENELIILNIAPKYINRLTAL